MSFEFTIGMTRFAEVSIDRVRGLPALGAFRLAVDLKFHFFAAPQGTQLQLASVLADVSLMGASAGWLARLTSNPLQLPLNVGPHGDTRMVYLEAGLSRSQVEALEDVRLGRDLNLAFSYFITVTGADGAYHPITNHEQHLVSQSIWVKALEDMRYTKMALLEVPIFDVRADPSLQEASRHLQSAQQALLHGDWRGAVGACRDVLEAMTRVLGDKDEQLVKLTGSTRDLTKAERLRLLRQAFKVFTHPARHADEVSASFEWSRRDAVSAVSITAALLYEMGAPGAQA